MNAPSKPFANPGERRNQWRPDWDRLERIVPPVFNAPTEHRPTGGVGPGRILGYLPVPAPVPTAAQQHDREPAPFSHLRHGSGGQAEGGDLLEK